MRKNITIVFGGHKDHGKSTVLGRMFYDTGNISEDMMNRLRDTAKEDDNAGFEFAYVMDAYGEERQRGITIDLGHKKLITDEYSFTFADAPGHKDFINQMKKGAGESDAVVIVVDVSEGVKEQTKEHLQVCRDIGIDEVIVVINKMDILDYDQAAYEIIERDVIRVLFDVGYGSRHIIPCSALHGENIAKSSDKMDWYEGMTLLGLLEAHFEERPALGLAELVTQSKDVLIQMVEQSENPAMLWAGGKDSTVMLSMARDVFGDPIPFKVVLLDTGYQFKETYDYMEKYAEEWQLDFIRYKNTDALGKGISPKRNKFECCNELKTKNLFNAMNEYKFTALAVGIRWDEHGVRGKESFFSDRQEPYFHKRVHPMLNWSEKEVWEYLRGNSIPYNCLYDRVEHGDKVIRSIGCWPCTQAVSKDIKEERASRDIDKEGTMEQLRSLGYM